MKIVDVQFNAPTPADEDEICSVCGSPATVAYRVRGRLTDAAVQHPILVFRGEGQVCACDFHVPQVEDEFRATMSRIR